MPIGIGALLKLPNLIIENKQDKQWTFDWIKFIAIILPYLYIISVSILPFVPLGEGISAVPDIIRSGSPTIQTIAGVVLGYTLLDSLKKQ